MSYTAPARFLNSRAMWAVEPMLTTAQATANPATVFDNRDGVGAWVDRLTVTGHSLAHAASLFTGPATNLNIRNKGLVAYVKGGQGTTTEPLEYLAGIQQGTTTFTPTLIGSNGAGTHTYNSRSGRMVVPGDEVTYYVRINATTDATNAFQGVLRIGDSRSHLGQLT